MENIKSFDCTPSPAMKAVMANFSYGMSTFNDSVLNCFVLISMPNSIPKRRNYNRLAL